MSGVLNLLNIGSDEKRTAPKICRDSFVHNTVVLNESQTRLWKFLWVLWTSTRTWIGDFPIPNRKPIGVGCFLFFKWSLKCVQNIPYLKGTNCISSNSIFRSSKNSVYYFSFFAPNMILPLLNLQILKSNRRINSFKTNPQLKANLT